MVRKRPIAERQPRPRGDLHRIDDAWKKAIEGRMELRNVTRAALARHLGVRGSAITNLFKPHTKHSRLVPAIHKFLEFEVTTEATPAVEKSDEWRELKKLWAQLDDAGRTHLVGNAKFLVTKR